MACFIVPATEAVITTVATKVMQKKGAGSNAFAKKLSQLSKFLWGGSALLAFEHVWHGEVTPFFPFLTAANDPADTAEMLYEMATSGTAMAVLVTATWAVMLLVEKNLKKKPIKEGV